MIKKSLTVVLVALSLGVCVLIASDAPVSDVPSHLNEKSLASAARWPDVMNEIARWDRGNTFPENGVLFVGSSSIRGWATREYFPTLPVINRGFGGSIYSDIIHHIETVVYPYDPALVVFYSGDNDPLRDKSPEDVEAEVKLLVSMVWEKLPQTPILLMAVKQSQSRQHLAQQFIKTNKLLEKFACETENLYFFDSMTALLDEEGYPDPKFYRDDKLHLSPEGYTVWAEKMLPVIEGILSDD